MLDRPTPKSAETRARIVRGALQALERHGLGETTTRRIAEEAGVRLATLHYHFDSKETLLLAVFDGLMAEMTTHLAASAAVAEPLTARIAGVLHASWAYVAQTRAQQIVQYELTLYALRTRGAAWLAAKQYQAYADLYETLLRTAITGQMQLDSGEAETVARMMLAGMDGLILQGLAGASDRQSGRGLDALITGARAQAERLVGGRGTSGDIHEWVGREGRSHAGGMGAAHALLDGVAVPAGALAQRARLRARGFRGRGARHRRP